MLVARNPETPSVGVALGRSEQGFSPTASDRAYTHDMRYRQCNPSRPREHVLVFPRVPISRSVDLTPIGFT